MHIHVGCMVVFVLYNIFMRINAYKIFLFNKVVVFIALFVFAVCFNVPFYANAQSVSKEVEYKGEGISDGLLSKPFFVSPVVENEKAKPRDIIKKELLITNNTDKRVDLYITVENVDPNKGDQDFKAASNSDLSTSLANWIEITRGVIELSAGESRKIPYLIHVNLSAKPGIYYSKIKFSHGRTRKEAEMKDEGASLLLNVEVVDDAKERLQLGNFVSDDSVVLGDTASFSYKIENTGNRRIEPRGTIRIFNRRGEEVGSVPLNADGNEISPNNNKQLAAVWSTLGRFGKYKAYLDLEYGEKQLASVQDTVYFWVFPWKEIMASIIGIIILAIVGTYIVHMRVMARPAYARRQNKQNTEVFVDGSNGIRAITNNKNISKHHISQTQVVVSEKTVPTVSRKIQKRIRVTSGGNTIQLTKRNHNNHAKINGNVVKLQSRR